MTKYAHDADASAMVWKRHGTVFSVCSCRERVRVLGFLGLGFFGPRIFRLSVDLRAVSAVGTNAVSEHGNEIGNCVATEGRAIPGFEVSNSREWVGTVRRTGDANRGVVSLHEKESGIPIVPETFLGEIVLRDFLSAEANSS